MLQCRLCLCWGGTGLDMRDLLCLSDILLQFLSELTGLSTLADLPDQNDDLTTNICGKCINTLQEAYKLKLVAQKSYLTLCSKINAVNDPQSLKSVTSKDNLKQDANRKHNKKVHDSQHKCTACGKVFAFKSSWQRHQLQHNRATRVPCSACGSTFPDDTLLQRHVKNVHSERKFSCDVCGAKFANATSLTSHSKSHLAPSERTFRCEHDGCDKTFNFAHHLKHHKMTHAGVKQYFCYHCGKGYVQSHHLVSHIKTHSPQEWLECDRAGCGKRLPNKYALKRHLMIHNKRNTNHGIDNLIKTDRKAQGNRKHKNNKSQANIEEQTYDKEIDTSTDPINTGDLLSIQSDEEQSRNSKVVMKSNKNPCDVSSLCSNKTVTAEAFNFKEKPVQNICDIERLCLTSSEIICNDQNSGCCQIKLTPNNKNLYDNYILESCGSPIANKTGHNVDNKQRSPNANMSLQTENIDSIVETVHSNDCTGFLGKCIVSSEECICAKVNSYQVPMPEYLTAPLLTELQQQGFYTA